MTFTSLGISTGLLLMNMNCLVLLLRPIPCPIFDTNPSKRHRELSSSPEEDSSSSFVTGMRPRRNLVPSTAAIRRLRDGEPCVCKKLIRGFVGVTLLLQRKRSVFETIA